MNKEKIMSLVDEYGAKQYDAGVNYDYGSDMDAEVFKDLQMRIYNIKKELYSKPIMPKVFDYWYKCYAPKYRNRVNNEKVIDPLDKIEMVANLLNVEYGNYSDNPTEDSNDWYDLKLFDDWLSKDDLNFAKAVEVIMDNGNYEVEHG